MSDARERARAAAEALARARATVTGKELGDPADGIKPLRASAKALLKDLQANDAEFDCPALGAPVHVRSTGIKKVLNTSADVRKLQVLPVLRELFADAEKIGSEAPYDGDRDRHAVAYHKLRAVVVIDGQSFAVRVVVKEDAAGQFHYDHTVHGVDEILDSTKKNAPDDRGASDTTSKGGGLSHSPHSQCPTDPIVTPVEDGSQVVLDAVASAVIERARAASLALAQARAAAALGEPEVGEHGHEFRRVLTPMVLYRSVSPEEWEAINEAGAITGGLNKFNPWDSRREVFFGAEPSEMLLHQGGELSRRAEYHVMAGKLQKDLDAARKRIASLDADLLELAEEFGHSSVRDVPRGIRITDPGWLRIVKKQRTQEARIQAIQSEAREVMRAKINALAAADESRGYSAVLLTTKPLAGARMYQGKHSGMGKEAEYGMDSGVVKLSDIANIQYIKDLKLIDTPVHRVLDAAEMASIEGQWLAFDGLAEVSTALLDYVESPMLATMVAELAATIEKHAESTGVERFRLAERIRVLGAKVERRKNLQPVKLQNRDRSTAASIAQVQSIGKNPDPDLLGYNKTPTEGAPIVFADYDEAFIPKNLLGRKATVTFTKDMSKAPVQFAVVPADDVMVSHDFNGSPVEGYDALEAPAGKLRAVAGNGRAAGIQLAYEKGTASRYVAGLIEEAEMLQLDPAAIEALAKPMLVRIMRHEDVTADIGDKTNSSGMAGFSAVEQAKTDADRIDFDSLSFNEDGTPTLDALTRFVQAMPIAEQAALAPDGSPTNQALDRLMAATFNRAYQNDDLVKLYSQSLDPEIKNVLFGMAQAAGDMAALAGKGDYDIRGFVTDAATMASNAKRAGLPLSRMAEQRDMAMAEEANDIAGLFARSARSAKKIGDALRTLARTALQEADSDGEDMFGPIEKRPPAALVAEAVAG